MMRSRIFPMLVFFVALGLAMPAQAQKSKIKKDRKANETPVNPGGKASIKAAAKAQRTDSLQVVLVEELTVIDSIIVPGNDSTQPAKKYYTAVKESQLLAMENRLSVMRSRLELAEADLIQRQEQYEAGTEGANTAEELALAKTKLEFAQTKLSESDARLVTVRTKMEELGRLGLTTSSDETPVFEEDNDDEMEDPGSEGQGSGKGAVKNGGNTAPAPKGLGKGAIKGGKGKKRRKDRKKEVVVPDAEPEAGNDE